MSACRAPRTKIVASGRQRGAGPAGGLQPVRDRPVGVAAQPRHALDLDHPVGVDLDDRAHLLQHADQVDDLRLHRRVAQLGDALGAYRREQHLLGRADARVRQLELGAAQSVGGGQIQALGRLVDDRAELAQRLEVKVDRPVADVAAAQVRDERVAEPVQQRTAEQDRDAAGTGVHVDLIDAGALHVGRVEDHLAVRPLAHPDPVQLKQTADDLDVADLRHVVQAARAVAQQCGDHRLGHQVLRAPDPDLTMERGATMHAQNVIAGTTTCRALKTGRDRRGCGQGVSSQGNLDPLQPEPSRARGRRRSPG